MKVQSEPTVRRAQDSSGFLKWPVVNQHDRVPLAAFESGRRANGLKIGAVSRIFPHLRDVSGVPAWRLDSRDFAENDFGEKIRIIAAAKVDHVLDSSLAIEA